MPTPPNRPLAKAEVVAELRRLAAEGIVTVQQITRGSRRLYIAIQKHWGGIAQARRAVGIPAPKRRPSSITAIPPSQGPTPRPAVAAAPAVHPLRAVATPSAVASTFLAQLRPIARITTPPTVPELLAQLRALANADAELLLKDIPPRLHKAVRAAFPSVEAACAAADVRLRRLRVRWTAAALLAELHQCARKQGIARRDVPTNLRNRLDRQFGSLEEACAAAGLRYTRGRRQSP